MLILISVNASARDRLHGRARRCRGWGFPPVPHTLPQPPGAHTPQPLRGVPPLPGPLPHATHPPHPPTHPTHHLPRALALQPSKVPELRSQPEAQEGKRSWLGKLTRSKEASLEQMGAKLARGRYLEPLTPEEVGSKVEGQMGENLEQFAGFQGAVHDIMQQGAWTRGAAPGQRAAGK